MPWLDPSLTLKWGPYQKPDAEEQQAIATSVKTLLDAGLITKSMALEKLKSAGIIDVENIAAVVEELEHEAEEAQQKAMEMAQQQPPAQPEPSIGGNQRPDGDRKGGKRKQKPMPEVTRRRPNRTQ